MKVFILWEVAFLTPSKTMIIDIFSDWKQAEDARVGMNSQRTDGFLSYEIEERICR